MTAGPAYGSAAVSHGSTGAAAPTSTRRSVSCGSARSPWRTRLCWSSRKWCGFAHEVAVRRPRRDDVSSAVYGGLILCGVIYWVGVGLSWWFDFHPITAAVALAAGVGGAWFFGARHGHKAESQAHEAEKQADKQRKRAIKDQEEAKAARDRAEEDQRRAVAAIEAARGQEAAARLQSMRQDVSFVSQTRRLPLRSRIEAAATIGSYPGEEWGSFEARREEVIRKRAGAWESATRYGHRLLPVVETQHGLCGDPSKDPSEKGCGCYLYALPPTAVHLDHVVPRTRKGTDELENLQALCSACNISAGARTDDTQHD